MKYIRRTSSPSTSDPNWIHYSKGGRNYCSLISGNSVLPNCTGYCYGRWYELLGYKPNLCLNQAEIWFSHNDEYKRGQVPKLGAIAVYSQNDKSNYKDGCGHVEIVEKVYSDGSWDSSASAYGGSRFYTSHRTGSFGAFHLEGFIYTPIEFEEEIEKVSTTKQMKIKGGNTYFMDLNWNKIGTYPTGTIVNVIDGTIVRHYTQQYPYIKVNINGTNGYMCVDYLENYTAPVEAPKPKYVGTPISRNNKVDQLEIINEVLYVRDNPNGNKLGYANKGIYNVLDCKTANNYIWVEIESGHWVARNDEWNKYYEKVVEPSKEPANNEQKSDKKEQKEDTPVATIEDTQKEPIQEQPKEEVKQIDDKKEEQPVETKKTQKEPIQDTKQEDTPIIPDSKEQCSQVPQTKNNGIIMFVLKLIQFIVGLFKKN